MPCEGIRPDGLDGMITIYPTVAGALRARQDSEALTGNDGTDDVVDLIVADRTRIGLCCDELREAARSSEPARAIGRQ